jgi:transportin-3
MIICGLHVQHREACCSMLDFTRNLLYARNEDLVDILGQVLPPRGGALVRSLLAGALGALPSSRLSDISGVIAALLSCTNAQSVVWLREATSLIPDHVASASDKDVFFLFGVQVC